MLEVDHCVIIILQNMALDVLFETVQMQDLQIHLHVRHISQSGENTQNIEPVTLSLECAECWEGLEKINLGIHVEGDQTHNVMMIIMKILQSCSILLCGNHLQTMWCCSCLDKICKIRVNNQYIKVVRICLQDGGITS